jgi:inosose dehydratase
MIELGIAPIGWTNDDLPELGGDISFEQCISEMEQAGYSGCEVGNKFPRDPKELSLYLNSHNLKVAAAWFSAYLTTKPFEETKHAFIAHRDFLHAVGANIIVVSEQGHSIQGNTNIPVSTNQPIFIEKEWSMLFQGLEKLGDLAAEKGMKIVYHPHMGTGVQTNADIARLMDNTNPQKVSLLYDCGHLYFSRENIYEVLEKYMDRIAHIHLKDVREEILLQVESEQRSFLDAVKAGVFTVPGDGNIHFGPIFEAIRNSDYKGWVIVEAEQDPAKANPYLYAKKARSFIQQQAGW